ncbi:alpha-glucan family phosphorylase [Lignipirellula cremea]|uniref:Maltodextrin phosphorylase n=1 Tax=Lignipirellula cremea TaxID=2528010 RepID=A0A518DNM5_9BACT|nr:alpha-glucan family phosphorylase [Lignipirellula cremea]QDU93413.1 Maltodextrin phosphorylase [Lignipirellula cremea]
MIEAVHDAPLRLALDEVKLVVQHHHDPAETLSTIVKLIKRRFQTDVCSVYLIEPNRANLMLAATDGLRTESVGRIRMSLNEGLAGMVAQQLQPISVADAASHPRYKYFKDSGEEAYRSFLGAPLIDQGVLQGVLVAQTSLARTFSESETSMFVNAAQKLGPIVSEARALEQFIAPALERMWVLARNLWWCWDVDSVSLFRDIDPVRWRQLDHNPIPLLAEMSLGQLEERAGQMVLHSRINNAHRRLGEYLADTNTWGATHAGVLQSRPVAYFSAEFGIHESAPIYSGGLGLLSGDHVKSASDLGVPLVGVGLFYDQGYFRQRLDAAGWQQEEYCEVDVNQLPLEPALDAQGAPVTVRVETRSGMIAAKVWRVAVGRCSLLLLDADVPENAPEDRELTARLYGGDGRVRIRQELLLGIGGVRALRALGIDPGALHLNEGHSAFAVLETISHVMHSQGESFDSAVRAVAPTVVFTTHTPVPAGHDRFPAELVEEHLGPLRDALGLSLPGLLGLGRVNVDDGGELFCMTVLALKLSRRANGVSALHGGVSRKMWRNLWPAREEENVPIGHITNGVHVPSWLAAPMRAIYDRYLGSDWPTRAGYSEVWKKIDKVDDGELWETHLALKSRLLDFARRRASRQAKSRGESPEEVERLKRVLSPDALTIGFARRFATYKRADLVFSDLKRVISLVNHPQMPVQFVFAGKAHPRDEPGKRLLQGVVELAQTPEFRGKILFVEDYDINVGRHLVHGVDVWLNNPRRPLEASGTSGQKVVLNGGLNLSVLDGWWAEAFDGSNGFAIGNGRTHADIEIQDRRDADDLYRVLQEEVIPMYYNRGSDGLPREWIARMKNAIRTLGWRFSADRMVMDYTQHCYVPAAGGLSSRM